ncbi:MAG: alkaline shock response membrane anchor protein AmaP, partial [Anaerolineae bacterium]
MNIFNRVVVVLLLVALILISAAVIVLPKPAITVAREFVAALDTYASTFQGWVFMTIALLALMALCVVLVYLELRRVPSKTVRVEKISGGEARVAVESVAHRLQYNLDQLPQVLSVKPHVSARGKRVDITLDIETTQDVNIPAKTEEMSQITRSVIEEQMGLKLGKMIV